MPLELVDVALDAGWTRARVCGVLKLAHRGSYLDRAFVSSSAVDRVLARNGLVLAGQPRPARTAKKPGPD